MLIPTVFAGVLLGLFALHLGWLTHGMAAAAQGRGVREVLGHGPGLFVAIDLFGLAVAGGLFIVPAFSAVQAWAGSDRRARVVAAVNVLNAAFMTAAGVGVALLQKYGVSLSTLFLGVGVANLVAAALILRTMPTNPLRDLLTVIFRAFFRLEITGLDNIAKAGPNAIIALNHVSFLDAAVALSFLDREPVFAIDSHDRQALVGQAVPAVHPRDAARSDEAARDPHAHPFGEGGQSADHLPGRPPHRDRQPDEGL